MFTDIIFLAGINSAVRFHSKTGAKVYYYCFDYRGSNSFITVFMNATFDTGECLQFAEHVEHFQCTVKKTTSLFPFRPEN